MRRPLWLVVAACVAASAAQARQLTGLPTLNTHVDEPNPSKLGFAAGTAAAYATNAAFALENLPRTLTINRTATECGAAVKTLDDYFKSVYPLASKPAKQCIEAKSPANSLRFFYDNAPDYLITRVGGQPVPMPKAPRLDPATPVPDYDFNPPKLWEPTVLFGNDNCTFYINHYPPKAWWEFEGVAGVPSGSAVEVTHVKVSGRERGGSFNQNAPFNPALYNGFFWYYAPGSGVYYNVGQTYVGANKLAVLNQLGTSFDSMATSIFVPTNKFFPGQATHGIDVPITTVYDYMTPSAKSFSYAQLLEIGAYGTTANLPAGFDPADLYMANRLANNGKMDGLIAPLVKARNLNSYQLTIQPNSNGGWGYEIVQNVLDGSITTYGQFFAYIQSFLSTRDPCKGEFDVETPIVPAGATTLDPAGTCTFDFTTYYCVVCEQQDVKTVCGYNRPIALDPTIPYVKPSMEP